MDIAATLVRYLDEQSDVEWYHNAPTNTPDEFGTLTRDGGPSEIVRDNPTITAFVYGGSRPRSEELAEQARQLLLDAQYEIDGIFGCEIFSIMHENVDGRHRHRITASLIVND